MAAAGHEGETKALSNRESGGMELCPALTLPIPVGEDPCR